MKKEYQTLTEYDLVRKCYKMKSKAKQGKHLQRLGELEHIALYILKYKVDDMVLERLENLMSEEVLDE